MVRAITAVLVALLAAAPASAQELTQLPGRDGCITPGRPYSNERCATAPAVFAPDSAVVSPDGRNVYVAARDPDSLVDIGASGVLSFARGRGGALTSLACITDDGTDGREGTDGACTDGNALTSANAIAASPDGRHVYATSDAGGIAILARSRDGKLAQAGCVKDFAPASVCTDAFAMPRPVALVVSPDGRHVYATSRGSHAVLVFARDAATGGLTQTGCVSDSGGDGAWPRATGS